LKTRIVQKHINQTMRSDAAAYLDAIQLSLRSWT